MEDQLELDPSIKKLIEHVGKLEATVTIVGIKLQVFLEVYGKTLDGGALESVKEALELLEREEVECKPS